MIEDAAHAAGSSYAGRYAGTFGIAGSFSFYPTKIATSGEGGMIVTNDQKVAEHAHCYRDQGKIRPDQNLHVRMGHNWRMSELHACIGIVQTRRIEHFIKTKRSIAHLYKQALKSFPDLCPILEGASVRSNYHKFVVLLDKGLDRQAMKIAMREKHGVHLGGEVYDHPLHLQPIFREHYRGNLPVAEDVCARHICLPIHSDMTLEEAHYVISALPNGLKAARENRKSIV